jgi:predicted MPP superfamily phosphohydrolase
MLTDEKIASWPIDVGIPAGRSSTIYVNRGLGTIGAPIRLGVPPEITQIKLRRA